MKKTAPLAFIVALLLMVACGERREAAPVPDTIAVPPYVTGDTICYGLVCDGTTDTLLVLLRNIYANPDTFNVLEATRQHRIFGLPKIGDRVVLLPDSDSAVARMAVNLDQLCGSWCYQVVPKLRQRVGISDTMRQQFISHMSDSVRDSLFAPREHGFQIKSDGSALSIGAHFADDSSPLQYPEVKRYRQWSLHNCQLVLYETTRDSVGSVVVLSSDTTQLVLLRRDSLVLHFADGNHSYYRKKQKD